MDEQLKEFTKYNTKGWDAHYAEHGGVEYPHEQLVIYVNYLRRMIEPGSNPKALEIGFGSIADMVFLNRMKYEVSGLEVSDNAVRKGLEKASKLGVKLNLQHWSPPALPFDNAQFDLFCSSNSIHFNLDQNAILSEVSRVLKPNGHLYTTYLAPGHKFIGRSNPVGDDLIQFTEDHYVPKMRGMVMKFFDDAGKLKELYTRFFNEVRVTRLEYDILDAPNAYWIVTAKNREH